MTYNDLRSYVVQWYGFHPDTKGCLEELILAAHTCMKEEGDTRKWEYLTSQLAIRFAQMMDKTGIKNKKLGERP